MNKDVKQLIHSFILAAFFVTYSASGVVASEISVTGSAKAKAPPDYATLDVNIQNLADRAEEATERIASIHNKVMESLQRIGLGESDVATTKYMVGPHWERLRDKKPKFLGYRASHQLTVQIRDMAAIGKVVDAVIEAGATSVSDVKFITEFADSLQDAVLDAAVRQAYRRAKRIALSSGGKLGEMIELYTEGAAKVRRQDIGREMFADDVTGSSWSTTLIPRMNTISITVFGRWRFVKSD